MFGRSNDPQPVTPARSEGSNGDSSPADAPKGRPTPKRKDAEAANKRPLVSTDRKGAAKTDRAKAKSLRDVEYRAMQTGDERNMPAKDRGPVRRFMRDAVDARWNLGEFFLPVAGVMLVAQFAFGKTALGVYAILALYAYVILATLDAFLLWRSVKKRLQVKFGPDVALKGAAMYTVLRAFQIRPSRLPKPQVKHGQRPV